MRRDWCLLSKDIGDFVLSQILSGAPREEVVERIHAQLMQLAAVSILTVADFPSLQFVAKSTWQFHVYLLSPIFASCDICITFLLKTFSRIYVQTRLLLKNSSSLKV